MLPLALSNGDVILLVVFVALPLAAIAFAGAGAVYKEIGKGAFSMDHDLAPKPTQGGARARVAGEETSSQVKEAEIRQMLEAKAFRQTERGEQPLDIEAELARLTAPATPRTDDLATDPALVEEVRQLVVARNERRVRAGKEPLEVEAEIRRQLRDLEGLGQ